MAGIHHPFCLRHIDPVTLPSARPTLRLCIALLTPSAQSSTLEDSSIILPSVPGSAGNTAYVSDPRFPNLSKGASRPGHSEGNWVFILPPPRSCSVHVLRSCDTLSKRSMPALLFFWRSRFVHLSLPAAT